MVTVGDPLLDLGWPACHLAGPALAGPAAVDIADTGGLPDHARLVAAYAEASARDLSAITWYRVLACFKLGIVLEGTHARALRGPGPRRDR